MYNGTIQVRTRGKKRCAPNCTLFNNGHCAAGLDAHPLVCGKDCPKDGDYALVRADKVADATAPVKANIGKEKADA